MGRKKKICGNEPGQQKLGSFFAHPPGPPTGQDDSTSDEDHDISGLPPDSSATAAAATPGFAAPSAVPPSAVPPSAVPPSAVPPSAVPPSAVPPSAVPPSAVPPSAVPPSAVPPSPLQSQPNPEPDTEPTSPPTPAKKRKIDNFSDLPEKSRSAIGSYCDKYSWLEFVKPGLDRCSSCKASQEYHAPAKPTTWSSGYVMYPPVPEKLNSGNWRANTFRMHEKQTEHKNSLSSKKPPKVQKIDRAVKEMEFQNLGDFAPTKRAIKTVLFTIQEELPIRKAEKIREFMMTVLSESSETAGLMHARHKSNWSTYTFIAAINGDVQTRQLERLKKYVAFTLHADESTDISANSFLLLYVQYTLVDEGGNTEVHPTEFLTVLKVKNGKSVTITNRIIGFFAGHDIDLTKMVMFTSDGANAMLGRKSGVATRLRAVVGDHLIDYHCVSHREALAMKHAYQKFKVWTDLEKDIRSLIKFLAQGKQRTGIEYLTNFLEQDYVEIPKIIDIRWLSRVKSIEALITDYYVLLEFLKAQANGNDMDMGEVDREIAKGFHDNFSKMERLWMIHRLGDLLEPFDVLMKISQKKNMHPYNILQHTETVIKTLQERYHFDGNQPVCWDGDHISQLRISFDESEPEVDRIEPTTLRENWPQVQNQVDINVVKLAEELTKQIQSRCGSEKEAGILKETVIFDVGRIRKFNGKLDDYGVESLEKLYTHYKDFVEINSSQMRKEWRHLLAMYSEHRQREEQSPKYSWRDILDEILTATPDGDLQYPNLAPLARVILTFNAQNAEVERGFSTSNRLKTKLRNRLSPIILDVLMRLSLISESWATYPNDYNSVVELWLGSTARGRYGLGRKIRPPMWMTRMKKVTPPQIPAVHAGAASAQSVSESSASDSEDSNPDQDQPGTSAGTGTGLMSYFDFDDNESFPGFTENDIQHLQTFVTGGGLNF